jgi:hypothetical protein
MSFVLKLSEKGFERASEREFGRCSVPKRDHPDPREATVLAPPGLFRQFHAGVLSRSGLPSAGVSLGYLGTELDKGRLWAVGSTM